MKIILRIVGLALRHKGPLLGAYLCTVGASVAYLLLPRYLGKAIDKIAELLRTGSVSSEAIISIILIILGLSLVRGVLSYGQTFLAEATSQLVSYDLRNAFFNTTQHLSFAFHDRNHTGNLMSRAITDIENLRMFINMGVVRAPYFFGLFIVVAIILIVMDWRLGLLSTSFMPLIALHSAMVRLKARLVWLRVQEKMGELTTVLQENLQGVRVVKAFASEDFEEAKFDRKSREVSSEYVDAERLMGSNSSFLNFVFLVAIGLILWYGGWRVIHGQMTAGELAQFIFYMQILAMPVRMTGQIVNAYARAVSAGQRLFEILDARSDIQEKPGALEMPRVRGHVRFENVSFSYGGKHPALRDVSFEAKPGQVIALVGAPGSGKSTIVNLVPRFYDVTSGRITIDGVDIRDVTLESLRRNIGIVQQDVFLFTTSIRENIAYGRHDASIEEIVHAARVAQLDDFVSSLEEGYDTEIGERGSTLSGGQRQRLAIARAVLLDPPILILDDSTSSVDARTEEQIRKAMESVMQGRTTFVIAHRLGTVHRADMILVLRDGQIVERGTHKELLALNGSYREIYELQLRPQEEVMREVEVSAQPVRKVKA